MKGGETDMDRIAAVQAAELGLACAVLAWRQRTSGGFRRFARSTIMRQLLSPVISGGPVVGRRGGLIDMEESTKESRSLLGPCTTIQMQDLRP